MRYALVVTLITTLLFCSGGFATQNYGIKNIRLGGNLLEAYHLLKSRYGDAVSVKQWRQHGSETISLIAQRSYCGARHQGTCERMTVSSVLPLYRDRVVRIELHQTFIQRRSEEALAASLMHRYGTPFIDRTVTRRRSSARTIVWSGKSLLPPARVDNARSWIDYRALGGSFLVAWFTIEHDGKISEVNLVSENDDLREKNSASILDDGARFRRALIREEIQY